MTTRSFNFLESFLRRELDLPEIPANELNARIEARFNTGTMDKICRVTNEEFSLPVADPRLRSRMESFLTKFCSHIQVTISSKELENEGGVVFIFDPSTGYEHRISYTFFPDKLRVSIEKCL